MIYNSVRRGKWSSDIWAEVGYPVSGDDVIINHRVKYDIDDDVAWGNCIINHRGVLIIPIGYKFCVGEKSKIIINSGGELCIPRKATIVEVIKYIFGHSDCVINSSLISYDVPLEKK